MRIRSRTSATRGRSTRCGLEVENSRMLPSHRQIVPGVLIACLAPVAQRAAGGTQQPSRLQCAQLLSLQWPDVNISGATAVPAAGAGAVRVAHCRVDGVIGTEIHFSLLLPEDWNGKFFMVGGGGFVGSVQNSALSTVNAGYATVGTDTGHQGAGTDASWALDNLERRVNFGYLAIHRTAGTAQAILRSHYGAAATRSYFQGCSRGGGQALMEAQRFPEDFDGIVAGAPAFDWTGLAANSVAIEKVLYPDPKHLDQTPLDIQAMKKLQQAILDQCDAQDGLKDGIVQDPPSTS